PRAGAVLIDPLRDAYVNTLRVSATEGRRTAGPVCPLISDHDDAITMSHFRMNDLAFGIRQHFARLEAERLGQPFEGSGVVLVDERGDEGRTVGDGSGHASAPDYFLFLTIFNCTCN